MSILFDQPAWAWAALAIALAALALLAMSRRPLHAPKRSWRWTLAGIVLPLIAAICIALALAGASLSLDRNEGVLILLDFSASARTSPWHDPAWVRLLAQKRLGPNQRVTIAGFGAAENAANPTVLLENTAVGDASAWPSAWPPVILAALESSSARLARSDLQAPLDWHAPAPHWIITDGLCPAPAPGPPASAALAWTILPPSRADLAVTDLQVRSTTSAPGDGSADGSVQLEILAQLRAAAWPTQPSAATLPDSLRAQVEIFRDGAPIATQPIEFLAQSADGSHPFDAARWLTLHDQLDAQAANHPHRYDVQIKPSPTDGASTDPWPEDDRASVIWAPPDKLRVLVIGENLPPEMAGKDVTLQRISPAQFTGDLQTLLAEGWQALVFNDVPAQTAAAPDAPATSSPLSPAAVQTLDRFVRDTGGGLLILSNGHAFGPGRYGQGSPTGDTLEHLSPVWSHPHEGAGLDVIFLLDASASMNETVTVGTSGIPQPKFQLLAQGVQQAANLLSADDRLTLIAFNDHAQTLLSQTARQAQASLPGILRQIHPAGPTAPDAALPNLSAALQPSRAAAARVLVILVTDGEIPALDVPHWRAALTGTTANVTAARPAIQLSIIAPPSASSSPLEKLNTSLPASQWLKTQDPAAWPTLLHQTLATYVRGSLESTPLDWQSTPAAQLAVRGTARSWTRVWLKPEATLLAAGDAQTDSSASQTPPPLAALAQRGLGQVAAIAISDAPAAQESPPYLALRNRILRRIAASPGDRRFHITVQRDHSAWRVAADALAPATPGDDSANFINGADLLLRLNTAASDPPPDLPLPQTAPGHYETRIASAGALSAVIIRRNAPQSPSQSLVARIQTADVQTSEWPATVDHPLIPQTGLLLPSDLSDAATWAPQIPRAIPLTNYFWLASVLAALTALFLRR